MLFKNAIPIFASATLALAIGMPDAPAATDPIEEVGYAPQTLVAAQQYSINRPSLFQAVARVGESQSDNISDEELLLTDLFNSSSEEEQKESSSHEHSSGANLKHVSGVSAALAVSVGAILAYM
ncbi:hypothetical protein GGI25_003905 [Coemansia spiralis]|uniref:Uncharacterized protein n=2 Tax=Coemansia TaxID=4863 RepID=A0A9W8G6F7_9FUNG|nr:hypothetical protein BX070DRAFT_231268 [Coemansia spiralis]KAJ1991047.1 hypothetical protein EDC05_003648 [Coemansia umbellata]KAJ2621140.1 hypothetical protein GGI26_004403 [Coemansia sp. RSA 1358]KAJ2675707.1 hypothetical protein GGI25_003905 [Coemansia spiralis]